MLNWLLPLKFSSEKSYNMAFNSMFAKNLQQKSIFAVNQGKEVRSLTVLRILMDFIELKNSLDWAANLLYMFQ